MSFPPSSGIAAIIMVGKPWGASGLGRPRRRNHLLELSCSQPVPGARGYLKQGRGLTHRHLVLNRCPRAPLILVCFQCHAPPLIVPLVQPNLRDAKQAIPTPSCDFREWTDQTTPRRLRGTRSLMGIGLGRRSPQKDFSIAAGCFRYSAANRSSLLSSFEMTRGLLKEKHAGSAMEKNGFWSSLSAYRVDSRRRY